jgi:integrase
VQRNCGPGRQASLIRVEHGLHRVEGKLQLGPVKTDGSARLIPIPTQLLGVIRAHRSLQESDRVEAGAKRKAGGYVFATRKGTPIEPRNVNRHFDRLCESTGVRRIRTHDLRHSCASLLYSQGVPLDQIQDNLGHESPTATKLIYVDVAEEIQRDAMDRLDFLFEDPEE